MSDRLVRDADKHDQLDQEQYLRHDSREFAKVVTGHLRLDLDSGEGFAVLSQRSALPSWNHTIARLLWWRDLDFGQPKHPTKAHLVHRRRFALT